MFARLRSLAFCIGLAANAIALNACGGGGGGSAPAGGALPSNGGGSGTGTVPQGSATATFAVNLQQYTPVNTAAKRRQIAFISPATAQISLRIVSVNGVAATGSPMTFGVSPNSPNCAGSNGIVSCNLAATIPIGNDVLTAGTLDVNGRSLGSSTITANVQQNATNVIALAVGGEIANLQIYLSQNHFVPGTPLNSNVIVVPLDQSGAEIVNPGNYNPAIIVTSSSSAGGHISLITDGTNTGQTSTLNSPNDQVVVAYDGGGVSGTSTIKAAAGSGITASKNVSINAAGLSASPSGAQLVSSISYIFTAAGQMGTLATSGGTPPYTVTSSDATLATVAPGTGTGPFTITAVGYGLAGSATITVTDSALAQTTIPVTFIAPAITLTPPGVCPASSCTATGVAYTIPITGPAGPLPPTTITASGGTGTYTYFFISSGATTSAYVNVSQVGGQFTITPSGLGNDALVISSGNQTKYYAITASADAFGASLPAAIGMIVETVGKTYTLTLPPTVTGYGTGPNPAIAGEIFNPGTPPSIDALPATAAHGTFTFTNNFGANNVVPYTVFGLSFPSYAGGGASMNSEQSIPADEAFTGTGAGESEIVSVSGLAGNVTAQSSNTAVVSITAPTPTTFTTNAVGTGTATITVTDTGTGASATYTVSVTTTTIPVTGLHRQQ
jgi:hypothetical protein